METDVDTSAGGFVVTPRYTAQIAGLRGFLQPSGFRLLDGFARVTAPKATGFRLQVLLPQGLGFGMESLNPVSVMDAALPGHLTVQVYRMLLESLASEMGARMSAMDSATKNAGEMIHEVGTARMGHSDKDSVVNQYGQAWAVPNLFVTDGAVLVSSPDKNPTLSILALAWRSSDHLAKLAKEGAL